MAHLTSTLALAGWMLLGAQGGAPVEASVESRLRAEVDASAELPTPAPPPARRVLPTLRESKPPAPVPLKVQRDASAGVRI